MDDYSSTMDWLRNLLSNSQSMYGSQWGQGLSANQQALADTLSNQRTLQGAQLAESGRQADAALALQRVIADWQNQLANKQYGLQSQAQKFTQGLTNRQFYENQTQAALARLAANPLAQAIQKGFVSNLFPTINFKPGAKMFSPQYNQAF